MSIGQITVDLLARTGSFETDMGRAAKSAEKRAKEIDAAVSKAGAAVGLALGAAGAAALTLGKNIIDGFDALNDVADATGSTVEKISALENVAMMTGTSMDTVTSALTKFNNTLKEVDGKNGPSMALKAIGLDAKELKSIDPSEALRRVAVALSGFADDGNKARLVQELFGKSVKEVAPFLKDLAEKTELVGTVSKAQAANAEIFNKQLFAMKTQATEAARSIVGDLLPALNRFLQNASDIRKMGGFGLIVKDAAKDMIGLGRMTGDNAADIKKIMAERDKLQADMDKETRPLVRSNDSRKDDIAELNRYLALLRMKQRNEIEVANIGQDYGDAVSRKFMRPESVKWDGGDKKTGKSPGVPKDSELDRYIESLQKQLDKTKELTEAGMLLAAVENGRLKLGKGETIDRALQLAKELDASKSLTEENKRAIEFEAQLREARLKSGEEAQKQAQTMLEGNQSLRDEIALIGKNAEAQAAIEKARLSATIAMKEEELARVSSTEMTTRESAALEEQIRILKERQDLVGMKGAAQQLADDAKKTEELATSIGTSFGSAFEKAALEGGKLSDVLKGLVKDIAALTLRQAITVPISQSIGKALNFGGGDALDKLLGSNNAFGTGGGSLFGDFGKWVGGILGFADGGSPPVGKVSIVGERGPELFVPNTAGKIVPNHQLGGGGAPVNVVINNTIGDVASMAQVLQAQQGTERRIAAAIGRNQRYGGSLA
jgi:hypothetical protein